MSKFAVLLIIYKYIFDWNEPACCVEVGGTHAHGHRGSHTVWYFCHSCCTWPHRSITGSSCMLVNTDASYRCTPWSGLADCYLHTCTHLWTWISFYEWMYTCLLSLYRELYSTPLIAGCRNMELLYGVWPSWPLRVLYKLVHLSWRSWREEGHLGEQNVGMREEN